MADTEEMQDVFLGLGRKDIGLKKSIFKQFKRRRRRPRGNMSW
jgi:hypothetical protein